MRVIFDIEADSLTPTVIHCVICRDIDTGEWYEFFSAGEFLPFAEKVSLWVGHNAIGYDLSVLSRLWGLHSVEFPSVLDTLVVARLLNYNKVGGNSIENWGKYFNNNKIQFTDFSHLSKEMVEYCRNDVIITEKLFHHFEKFIFSKNWERAIAVEHQIAQLCNTLHENGFFYDKEKADYYKKEIQKEIESITDRFPSVFPARAKFIKEINPKRTLNGTLNAGQFRWLKNIPVSNREENKSRKEKNGINYTPLPTGCQEKYLHEDKISPIDISAFTAGEPFSRIEWVPFNPGSPKQCVEWLWEFGWEPTSKTKGHLEAERDGDKERLEYFRYYGWKIDDENLSTLPEDAPEAARTLTDWLLLNSRVKALQTWEEALRPSAGGWRVHGRFSHIGAWTGRMAHSEPNMANIPSHKRKGVIARYGKEFRSLWKAPEGKLLLGCDAAEIQLRVLAHYMNDESFTNALLNGRKEDGTDAHSLNQKALGSVCRSREVAKTFIYAWLLGAGIRKISQILGCSTDQAKRAVASFIESYPGLARLKRETIPADAIRGYFVGFDGRKVICNSEHFMLAGYLQNGEATVMKHACVDWNNTLKNKGIDYKFIDFVHDEWVTELDKDEELAYNVGIIQSEAIQKAGENLSLLCPMKGEFKIGENWYEVH